MHPDEIRVHKKRKGGSFMTGQIIVSEMKRKDKLKRTFEEITGFIKKYEKTIFNVGMTAFVIVACLTSVMADTSTTTTAVTGGMTKIIAFAKKIVIAIGGVLVIFGGLSYGLGHTQDNTDMQSRGLKALTGGAIICAVTGVAAFFGITI